MKPHDYMKRDLTEATQEILAIGSQSVKAIDCNVGDTVALLFGVYRVEMKDGRKQFIRQRDLTEVEQGLLARSLKVTKASNDAIHW